MNLMNNDQLITALAELRRMKTASIEAEVDFLHRLSEIEQDESIWRGDPGARTGYTTFAELLVQERMCMPSRLERFKRCVSELGFGTVRVIGFEAAALALPVPSVAKSVSRPSEMALPAIVRDLKEFTAKNDTPPSKQHAETIVRKHYVPEVAPRPTEESILAKCKRLEKENAKLHRDLERMKKRAEMAEAKLGRMMAPAASGAVASN